MGIREWGEARGSLAKEGLRQGVRSGAAQSEGRGEKRAAEAWRVRDCARLRVKIARDCES